MIEENKICFITCVNNAVYYEETKLYIKHLNVPKDMEIEFLPVYEADSMTAGYNEGMHRSHAKYKIYLHQDVFLTNKNFLQEMLAIFKEDPSIGMIGLAGCKKLHTSGIWWLSDDKYGNIYHAYTAEILRHTLYGMPKMPYVQVQAIDGLVMATQYDINWRQDLFTGWHFYDISQSFEFLRKAYKVVIPKQDLPWCVHACGSKDLDDSYRLYRKTFLQEYKQELNIE